MYQHTYIYINLTIIHITINKLNTVLSMLTNLINAIKI